MEAPANTVVLYQLPRGPFTPSLTPFAVKLETYLRLAKIPYQVDINHFNSIIATSLSAFSLSLYLLLSLSLSVCLSLCLSCLSFSLSVGLCRSLSVCLSLSVSRCLYLYAILSLSLLFSSLCHCLSVCLPPPPLSLKSETHLCQSDGLTHLSVFQTSQSLHLLGTPRSDRAAGKTLAVFCSAP